MFAWNALPTMYNIALISMRPCRTARGRQLNSELVSVLFKLISRRKIEALNYNQIKKFYVYA